MTPKSLQQLLSLPVRETTQVPYPGVQFEAERFLEGEKKSKIYRRYLHRWLRLFLAGQHPVRRKQIPTGSRALWIYNEKLNFGDAIMDMSGRALLKGTGTRVDLLTHPKLAPVFSEDDVFENVFTHPSECAQTPYDYVVLNEFNYKSIKAKTGFFKATPFACLFGYFFGPDRNQTEFSFAAVNDVFQLGLSPSQLLATAKPYLLGSAKTASSVADVIPSEEFICVAVGGIDPNRTYQAWGELLELLDKSAGTHIPLHVVLLGSENGVQIAQDLVNRSLNRVKVASLVDKLNLLQSRAVIDRSSLFLGVDGGLMHAAHSTHTPSVTLFAGGERSYLRLTPACHSVGIQSKGPVSDIAPQAILAAINQQLPHP